MFFDSGSPTKKYLQGVWAPLKILVQFIDPFKSYNTFSRHRQIDRERHTHRQTTFPMTPEPAVGD